MRSLNEHINEGQQVDKIQGTLANPGWTVVTYPRKIGGSKAEVHTGKIVSIKGNKIVVNFGGTVGGTTETLDLFKDIAITNDNIGYQSTYTVLDTEIITNADKENIHSFVGKSKVTKFAALDKKEFDRAVKGTAMGDYMKQKDMFLKETVNEELLLEKNFKQKVLGKTKSGREVSFPFQGDFKDFSLEDHQDAVRIYGDKIKGRFGRQASPMLKIMAIKQSSHSDWVRQLDGTDAKNNKAEKNRPRDNSDFYKDKFHKDGSKPWDNIA